jgi:hypothetical protein
MKKKASAVFFAALFLLALIVPIANAQITYPSPSWDYSPITPRVGDVVTFDASDFVKRWNENGESTIIALEWNFGDSKSATGAFVTHTFTSPGTYLAGVTATDNRGYGGTTQYEITVSNKTPITISLSLSDERIYTGQEVTFTGNLTFNGEAVPDSIVLISSKTYIEGDQWKQIATARTDARGEYSAVWKPTFGYYQVKATWQGNSTYPETSLSVILMVQGFGNLITDFSSNSTVRGLYFNSTTRVLSFSAEGPSGTSGYVSIILEKDPSFDSQAISVLLDGNPIEYTVDSTDQSWILSFTYTHSIHNIIVNLNGDKITESTSPPWTIPQETTYEIVVAVLVVVIVCLLIYYFRKRKLEVG